MKTIKDFIDRKMKFIQDLIDMQKQLSVFFYVDEETGELKTCSAKDVQMMNNFRKCSSCGHKFYVWDMYLVIKEDIKGNEYPSFICNSCYENALRKK